MTKEDNRRYHIGQAINVVLKDGDIIKGKVVGVRYQYPQPELEAKKINEGTPHELELPPENVSDPEKVLNTIHEHRPHDRINFIYTVQLGQRETGEFERVYDNKTKKVVKIPIFEPIYQDIGDHEIKNKF